MHMRHVDRGSVSLGRRGEFQYGFPTPDDRDPLPGESLGREGFRHGGRASDGAAATQRLRAAGARRLLEMDTDGQVPTRHLWLAARRGVVQ
jgi:hypothetical protein